MIFVTGGGGNVGGEVVRVLRSSGAKLRVGYHSPDKVERARREGIDAVAFDYAKPETLRPALEGADTLFLVSGNSPDQTARELAAVREAQQAGIRRIVKLSVWGAESESFSFAKIHRPVERAIEAAGFSWTFLRPNGFMQNVVTYMAPTIQTMNAFYQPAGESRISHIDVRDIAAVAARALTEDGHQGRAYDLSGPAALTYGEIADQLSAALGRKISYVHLPPAEYRQAVLQAGVPAWLADALLELYDYYRDGKASRVTDAVERISGRPPISFARFACDHAALLR